MAVEGWEQSAHSILLVLPYDAGMALSVPELKPMLGTVRIAGVLFVLNFSDIAHRFSVAKVEPTTYRKQTEPWSSVTYQLLRSEEPSWK